MQELLLCIDASTPHMALALGERGGARALSVFVREDLDRKNSERIGPAVLDLCERAGVSTRQIRGIVCGVGPGTFTGTRVAVATAKGLAMGLDARLWALDSLSIFAAPHAATAPGMVVLDARRQELYTASYGPAGAHDQAPWRRLDEVACLPIATVRPTSPPQWLAGTGTTLVDARALGLKAHQIFDAPLDPQWLWQASNLATQQDPVAPTALDVHYLRASYAEIGAHTPKTPPYRCPFPTPR